MMRVRYEDLVQDPDSCLKRVCSFVGLDFEQDMMTGQGFSPPKYTAGQHALVGRKPQTGRATAWRKSLSGRQIEIFESLVGELLPSLGYEPMFGLTARKITRAEQRRAAVREFLQQKIINKLRYRQRKSVVKP